MLRKVGHVEHRNAGMRAPAAALLLLGALRLVFLVDGERDALAVELAGTGMKVCVGSGNGGW